MDSKKKTTLWRVVGESQTLVGEISGLPDRIPKIGYRVPLEEYGEGVCFGYSYSGSGKDEELIEVKLLIRWDAGPQRPR